MEPNNTKTKKNKYKNQKFCTNKQKKKVGCGLSLQPELNYLSIESRKGKTPEININDIF